MNSPYKLIIFDMDGTILQDHFIYAYADHHGFRTQLTFAMHAPRREPYETSIAVAKLLKNHSSTDMLTLFRSLPTQPHLNLLLDTVTHAGLTTAVASASYHFLIEHLRTTLGLAYGFSNTLILDNDIATGEIHIHNQDKTPYRGKIYSVNKGAILERLCHDLNIHPSEVIAIGDGPIDRSMIEKAGLGVAFNAAPAVQQIASLCTKDLRDIIPYITGEKHQPSR